MKTHLRALVYFTQFTTALGGSEYLPLTIISELQKRCRVTLALNWKSDVARAARTLNIPIDFSSLDIVLVKPKSTLLRKLDAILPFYRTRQLQKLAKQADICLSAANMFDFGKPAHHFVFLLRHFGDNAFFDVVTHTRRSRFARFRQAARTLLAEGILLLVLFLTGGSHTLLDSSITLIGIVTALLTMLSYIEYAPLRVLNGILSILLYIMMLGEHPEQTTYLCFTLYSLASSTIAFFRIRKLYAKQQAAAASPGSAGDARD